MCHFCSQNAELNGQFQYAFDLDACHERFSMDAERLFLRDDDPGLAVQVTELSTPGTASQLTVGAHADFCSNFALGNLSFGAIPARKVSILLCHTDLCQRNDATVVDLCVQNSRNFRGTRIL
jgi:hypothetical protein